MALVTGVYVNGTQLGNLTSYVGVSLSASTADRNLSSYEALLGRQFVAGDVITFKFWSGISNSIQAASTSPTFAPTLTITGAPVTPPAADPVTPDTPKVDEVKPLPVWATEVVKSIPTLSKTLDVSGGHVALTSGTFSGLNSITIGGKAVDYKVETNGDVTIPVQAGTPGKTADIVVKFDGGILTVQDGIKYVAPVDVATVVERPVAIPAGAKTLSSSVADQVRQAVYSNMKNTDLQCYAYAASNSASAKAAAAATASQICAFATKANPALKAAPVTVIVNKAKAKTSAVGIKVYKQN
jgi:hypothetical protein